MSNLYIKKMDETDIISSSNLFFEVFTSSEWNFDWLTIEKAKNYFTDLFNTPNFIGFLLIQDDKVIGACLGTVNGHFINNQYEIKEIFIKPKLQNQGIGSLFLQEVENTLIDLEIDVIMLYTQKTVKAFEFYKKRDYVDLKDTVHMMKILESRS